MNKHRARRIDSARGVGSGVPSNVAMYRLLPFCIMLLLLLEVGVVDGFIL